MATKKTLKTVELLRSIWGDDIPSYAGSPHENELVDDAELILHELSHQVQLPPDFVFTPGNMKFSVTFVGDYLETLPDWLADLHELRAVTIELIVACKLGLRLRGYAIIENSARNTRNYQDRLPRYTKTIARAKKSQQILFKADTILTLIERVQKKGL